MKKIMKKALGLMLALVMVLALAPTNVNAADDPALKTDGMEVLNLIEGTVWRDFDPTEAGTLTIKIEDLSGSAALTVTDYKDYSNPIRTQLKNGESYTMNYVAGGNYEFAFECIDPSATVCALAYSVSFGGGDDSGSSSAPSIQGAGTENDPYILAGSTDAAPGVGHLQTAYYMVSGLESGAKYDITVAGSGMNFTLSTMTGSTAESTSMGPNATAKVTVTANGRGCAMFIVTSTYGAFASFNVSVEKNVSNPLGTETNPDTLVFDAVTSVTLTGDQIFYYYTWTAEKEGKLTLQVFGNKQDTTGYMFSISGGSLLGEDSQSVYVESTQEEEIINPATYYVKEGDELTIFFGTAKYGAGQVAYQATFEECDFPIIEVSKFDNTTADIVEGAIVAKDPLDVGENEAAVSGDYTYTLYDFCPLEAGVYKLEIPTGTIGYWGPNLNVLSNPNATSNVVTNVTIQYVGSSAIIGVSGIDADTVTITATKIGNVEEEVVTETHDYENTITPSNQTLASDFADYVYVDIEDTTVDKAVLGTDGYYHLNSADGPVLWVVLNDSWLSLMGAATANSGIGMLVEAIVEDGKVVEKINYSAALMAYAGCAATAESGEKLYPMTADLKAMLEKAGTSLGWYDSQYGIVGSELDTEDNWMFCTLYIPDVIEGADSKYVQGSKDGVTIRFNIPLAEFKELKVDGKAVDAKYYTKAEGSTIITLSAEYLDTLSAGNHAVVAVSTTGKTIETSITVATSTKPITADASAMVISLIVLAGAAMVTAGVVAKKRFA